MLEIKNLNISYDKKEIIRDLSFKVNENDFFVIVGPNGAGKSTIIKAISQTIPYSGEILYNEENLKNIDPKSRARKIGILLQRNFVTYSYKVREVVELGLYSHEEGFFKKNISENKKETMVDNILEKTGLKDFKDRSVLTLSGGELQRVFLAQALISDPEILILDEPTNFLDFKYQEKTFEIVDEFRKRENKSVIAVVHDLKISKYYSNRALLIKNGKKIAYGKTDEVFNKDRLNLAYEMDIINFMKNLDKSW